MLFSLNANASTSMLARMCSNWLKFRFHCKNGSTFSFYFNPRESPFLSNANFVILPHQGHIKSVLVCGTLFEKKGLLRTCKVLATQTIFVYNRGTFFHYISAGGMGTFQVFYNLHLTLHPSSIPLSNVSFYVPILGSKKGTCLSDGPALRGFQKGKLTYSFERISCSGHLKSESAVVRVH